MKLVSEFDDWVGKRIRDIRTEKRMTQRQLAEAMGLQQPNVAKLESGSGMLCSTLARAMAGLKASPVEFFRDVPKLRNK